VPSEKSVRLAAISLTSIIIPSMCVCFKQELAHISRRRPSLLLCLKLRGFAQSKNEWPEDQIGLEFLRYLMSDQGAPVSL